MLKRSACDLKKTRQRRRLFLPVRRIKPVSIVTLKRDERSGPSLRFSQCRTVRFWPSSPNQPRSARRVFGNSLYLSPLPGILMTNNVCVGVDVSKNILDTLFKYPAGQAAEQRSFSNAKTGRKKLISRLSQMPGAHVVMEATASYHLGLMYDLNEADIPFMVVNPFCAKAYGRSKNLRSKSDTIDANTLAEFGSERPFIPTQMPSDNQLKIRQLASVI